jgi:hypothetical protein
LTPYSSFIHAAHSRRELESLDTPDSRWTTTLRFGLLTFAFSGMWVFVVPLLPLMLPLYATALGCWCAVRAANAIANERACKRYELVSVLPIGSAGIIWTITQVTLRKMEIVTRTHGLITNLGVLGILSTGGFLLINAISLRAAITALLLMIALYLDFIQSTLIGAFVGIATAFTDLDRINVSTMSALMFLFIQSITYSLPATLLVLANDHTTMSPSNVFFQAILIGLIVLPLLREILLRSMWYWLSYRLESTPQEMNQAVGLK